MEIYKDIPNYEGLYQVSNLGNVKSLERKVSNQMGDERILKHSISKGYFHVTLFKNTIRKTRTIHQLVAETFLGFVPCGHKIVVDHINEIKTDNRLINLQLLTAKENVIKSIDRSKTSSKYSNVMWHKQSQKWRARITIDGKRKHLGSFDSELDAHLSVISHSH